MERLPADLCLKIFCCLDHHSLVNSLLVCRKWRDLATENTLWSDLFKERWGVDKATFYAPIDPKSWKDIYIVQDRCDRIGVGLRIIREGQDYFLVHQGEIQRHLGSRQPDIELSSTENGETESMNEQKPSSSVLDKILFFIGDLEVASLHAKRRRLM